MFLTGGNRYSPFVNNLSYTCGTKIRTEVAIATSLTSVLANIHHAISESDEISNTN